MVTPEMTSGVGVKAGTDLSITLNNRLSIVPGIYWEMRNKVFDEHSSTGKDRHARDINHYISVPVRLGVRLFGSSSSDVSGSILAGPYVSYGLGGTSRYRITKDGVTTNFSYDAFSKESQCPERFDYGVNAAFNLLIRQHFIVGVNTEFGFKHIYQTHNLIADFAFSFFPGASTHLALGLNLGYRF